MTDQSRGASLRYENDVAARVSGQAIRIRDNNRSWITEGEAGGTPEAYKFHTERVPASSERVKWASAYLWSIVVGDKAVSMDGCRSL